MSSARLEAHLNSRQPCPRETDAPVVDATASLTFCSRPLSSSFCTRSGVTVWASDAPLSPPSPSRTPCHQRPPSCPPRPDRCAARSSSDPAPVSRRGKMYAPRPRPHPGAAQVSVGCHRAARRLREDAWLVAHGRRESWARCSVGASGIEWSGAWTARDLADSSARGIHCEWTDHASK